MPHAITGEVADGLCATCEHSAEPKKWLGDPCTVPRRAKVGSNFEVIECSRYSQQLRINNPEETKNENI
ncbi:hypothetical protein ES702_00567 [subsurface metagenome]